MASDREALLKKLAATPDRGFCGDNAPAVETSYAHYGGGHHGHGHGGYGCDADKERTGDEGRQISHRRFFALSGHPRKQKGSTDNRDAGMKNAACKWKPKDLIQRTGWGIIRMST